MVKVKELFEQRYPVFFSKHPFLSWLMINFIRRLWREDVLQAFEQSNRNYQGAEFVKKGFEYINFTLAVSTSELDKIPKQGPLIVVANHPIGSLDGVGLFKLVAEQRTDTKVIANSLLYTVEQMRQSIIPTDNMGRGADRNSIKVINRHLSQGGALVIFPAGEVSRVYDGIIQDSPWNAAFIKLAIKNHCDVVPVYFDAKNSKLFYILSKLCFPLSSLWLIREIYYYKNKTVTVSIGQTFNSEYLINNNKSSDELSYEVREAVYKLS